MKRILHKFIASAIMLIALQITLTAQPVGSQIKTDTSGHISYWNGVDAWIPVAPGLPGQTLKFTAGVPSWVNNPQGFTTIVANNIASTTAMSGGNIASDGGAKITAHGVCWSIMPNPTIADAHTNNGAGIGNFASILTGLTMGTTYYLRAYATTSFGTTYGNEVSFDTYLLDLDGNKYDIVTIGAQVWMKQNLNTSRYNNGTAIPNVTDNATWTGLSTGARCYYNNDSVTYSSTYGALYNWYTVNTGNLCPTGWHVPTNSEWTTLITYLGGESIAGGKLKEAGLAHWQSPNANATNETGFSALPCGNRFYDPSTYFNIGEYGYWWCSAETGTVNPLYMGMNYNSGYVSTYASYNGYKYGISVRCLKD